MLKNLLVECIGSFAHVSFWVLEEDLLFSAASVGKYCGSIYGNDAIIVTRELRKRGIQAKCHLLNPTDCDMTLVNSILGSQGTTPFCKQKGERTSSLCLQNSSRKRSWVFSRVPKPKGRLGKIDADLLYIDCYPEFIEFLNQNEDRLNGAKHTYVNLSRITPSTNFSQLRLRPSILQASITASNTTNEASTLAKRILDNVGCQMAFVTMGMRGAVLAERHGEVWSYHLPARPGAFIGAGALFSTAIIVGLQKGLLHYDLLKWGVTNTVARLRKWEME